MNNEIITKLNNMMSNVIQIQNMNLPQQKKDEAKNIMNQTLDFVLEQSNSTTINKLVFEALKKRSVEKL